MATHVVLAEVVALTDVARGSGCLCVVFVFLQSGTRPLLKSSGAVSSLYLFVFYKAVVTQSCR